jgi:hypothetical protein
MRKNADDMKTRQTGKRRGKLGRRQGDNCGHRCNCGHRLPERRRKYTVHDATFGVQLSGRRNVSVALSNRPRRLEDRDNERNLTCNC